jgi:hypothetical protein
MCEVHSYNILTKTWPHPFVRNNTTAYIPINLTVYADSNYKKISIINFGMKKGLRSVTSTEMKVEFNLSQQERMYPHNYNRHVEHIPVTTYFSPTRSHQEQYCSSDKLTLYFLLYVKGWSRSYCIPLKHPPRSPEGAEKQKQRDKYTSLFNMLLRKINLYIAESWCIMQLLLCPRP